MEDPTLLSDSFKSRVHRTRDRMCVGRGPERDDEQQIRVSAGYRTAAPK